MNKERNIVEKVLEKIAESCANSASVFYSYDPKVPVCLLEDEEE